MGKYIEESKELLALIGGRTNIGAVTHCMTRMRFVLNDENKADIKGIESMSVVKGTFSQAGQFQVIFGNQVSDFYKDFIAVAGVEGVSFWQSIKAPASIYTTPMEIDTDGSYKEGSAVNKTTVIGVMFDRDAIAYNIFNDSMDTTPMNARGKFYNVFNNMNVRFTNDFTEKGIVLLLD